MAVGFAVARRKGDSDHAQRLDDTLKIHYTPKHGSRLNLAEIALSALERQCLDRRFGYQAPLEREVAA